MSLAGVALLAALAAAVLPCCRTAPPRYQARPGPYEELDAERLDALMEARRLADAGEAAAALALLEPAWAADPDNLPIGRMRQDLILELEGASGEGRLRSESLELLESGRLPALLLAARLEPDPAVAARWIEDARAADARSAWPPYAAAHLAARSGDWAHARNQVQRALELDPAHLPARRLEAALAARGNQAAEAKVLLRAWIAASASSPFVSALERLEAHLDLAHLLVMSGEAGDALELLTGLPEPLLAGGRAGTLVASAQQALGKPRRALEAAREAQLGDPGAALPLVQEALLQESYLEDAAAAREAWARVLELARSQDDLSGILLGMRARIALERAFALDSAQGAGDPAEGSPAQP